MDMKSKESVLKSCALEYFNAERCQAIQFLMEYLRWHVEIWDAARSGIAYNWCSADIIYYRILCSMPSTVLLNSTANLGIGWFLNFHAKQITYQCKELE